MTKPIPRVSIGMPVYNGEKYIRMALDSILRQDYANFELIISDNASKDATQDICREYTEKDQRIRYYRNETNIGASGNYNRVFTLAHGEFFKWISHDDECGPSLLSCCLNTFEHASADTVLVCSKAQLIDETGRVLQISQLNMDHSARPFSRLASLIFKFDYHHPHALWGLIKSSALRQTRLMGVVYADHILLSELALLGNLVEIPEPLLQWRIHSENALSINRTSRQLLNWHDPAKKKNRIILPHWLAWDLEYFRAVRHISLSGKERGFCYGVVLWRTCLCWLHFWRTKVALRTRIKKFLNERRRK